MNEERSFEQFVANQVSGDGGIRMPDDFYDDMHSFASRTRQRPEWLALIKEPPMRTESRIAVGSPTARVAAIMVATLLLAISLAAAGLAGSRLLAADGAIVVAKDGSGHYTTISDAIAASSDGDEIIVRSGVYAESLIIDKDISLMGDDRDSVVVEFGHGCTGGPYEFTCPPGTPTDLIQRHDSSDGRVLDSNVGPYGIRVDDSTARISDLTITPLVGNPSLIVRGSDVAVARVTVSTGDLASIVANGGSVLDIIDSDFSGDIISSDGEVSVEGSSFRWAVTWGDALMRGNDADGISVAGTSVVEGNTLTATDWARRFPLKSAIDVAAGSSSLIRDNIVSGFPRAIRVGAAATEGTIEGNLITDSQTGIEVLAPDTVVSRNELTGGEVGIRIAGGSPVLDANDVRGATDKGILISGTATPVLRGNTACDNAHNLFVGSAAEPHLENNEICADIAAATSE